MKKQLLILFLVFCFLGFFGICKTDNINARIFPEKPSHAIYIDVHGNINPETPLIERNKDIYTLTGDIYNQPIVIERENMVLDGNGYSLIGNGSYAGIEMSYRVNVTIKNIEISAYRDGIYSYNSNDNLFIKNTIKDNVLSGISLLGAGRCNVTDNVIEFNGDGIVCSGTQYGDFCYITDNIVRYNNGIGIDTYSDNILEDNVVVDNKINYNIRETETHSPTPIISPTPTPTSTPEPTGTEFPVFMVASIIILIVGSIGVLTYIVKIKRRS